MQKTVMLGIFAAFLLGVGAYLFDTSRKHAWIPLALIIWAGLSLEFMVGVAASDRVDLIAAFLDFQAVFILVYAVALTAIILPVAMLVSWGLLRKRNRVTRAAAVLAVSLTFAALGFLVFNFHPEIGKDCCNP